MIPSYLLIKKNHFRAQFQLKILLASDRSSPAPCFPELVSNRSDIL